MSAITFMSTHTTNIAMIPTMIVTQAGGSHARKDMNVSNLIPLSDYFKDYEYSRYYKEEC